MNGKNGPPWRRPNAQLGNHKHHRLRPEHPTDPDLTHFTSDSALNTDPPPVRPSTEGCTDPRRATWRFTVPLLRALVFHQLRASAARTKYSAWGGGASLTQEGSCPSDQTMSTDGLLRPAPAANSEQSEFGRRRRAEES